MAAPPAHKRRRSDAGTGSPAPPLNVVPIQLPATYPAARAGVARPPVAAASVVPRPVPAAEATAVPAPAAMAAAAPARVKEETEGGAVYHADILRFVRQHASQVDLTEPDAHLSVWELPIENASTNVNTNSLTVSQLTELFVSLSGGVQMATVTALLRTLSAAHRDAARVEAAVSLLVSFISRSSPDAARSIFKTTLELLPTMSAASWRAVSQVLIAHAPSRDDALEAVKVIVALIQALPADMSKDDVSAAFALVDCAADICNTRLTVADTAVLLVGANLSWLLAPLGASLAERRLHVARFLTASNVERRMLPFFSRVHEYWGAERYRLRDKLKADFAIVAPGSALELGCGDLVDQGGQTEHLRALLQPNTAIGEEERRAMLTALMRRVRFAFETYDATNISYESEDWAMWNRLADQVGFFCVYVPPIAKDFLHRLAALFEPTDGERPLPKDNMAVWLVFQLLSFEQVSKVVMADIEAGASLTRRLLDLSNPYQSTFLPRDTSLDCVCVVLSRLGSAVFGRAVLTPAALEAAARSTPLSAQQENEKIVRQALMTTGPNVAAHRAQTDTLAPLLMRFSVPASMLSKFLLKALGGVASSGGPAASPTTTLPNSNVACLAAVPMPRRVLMCLPVNMRREFCTVCMEAVVPANMDALTVMPSPVVVDTLCFMLYTTRLTDLRSTVTTRIAEMAALLPEGQPLPPVPAAQGSRARITASRENLETVARVFHLVLEMMQHRLLRLHVKWSSSTFLPAVLRSLWDHLSHTKRHQTFLVCEGLATTILATVPNAENIIRATVRRPQQTTSGAPDTFSPSGASEYLRRMTIVHLARAIKTRGGMDNPSQWREFLANIDRNTPCPWGRAAVAYFPEPLKEYYTTTRQGPPAQTVSSKVEQALASKVHNVLILQRGATPASTTQDFRQLLDHYSKPANQPLFLSVVWSIMIYKPVMLPYVRRVLQKMPPEAKAAADVMLMQLVLEKSDRTGADRVLQTLNELIWVHQLIPFEHALMGALRGAADDEEAAWAVRVVGYLLFESGEFLQRVRHFVGLGVQPLGWEDDNYHAALDEYFKKYPEYFDFEAYTTRPDVPPAAPLDSLVIPTIPSYYGNVCLRTLQYLDYVIARLIELDNAAMIERIIDAYAPLYAFHASPLLFVHDLMVYYHAAPIMQDPQFLLKLLRLLPLHEHAIAAELVVCMDGSGDASLFGNSFYVDELIARIESVMKPEPRRSDAWSYRTAMFGDAPAALYSRGMIASIELMILSRWGPSWGPGTVAETVINALMGRPPSVAALHGVGYVFGLLPPPFRAGVIAHVTKMVATCSSPDITLGVPAMPLNASHFPAIGTMAGRLMVLVHALLHFSNADAITDLDTALTARLGPSQVEPSPFMSASQLYYVTLLLGPSMARLDRSLSIRPAALLLQFFIRMLAQFGSTAPASELARPETNYVIDFVVHLCAEMQAETKQFLDSSVRQLPASIRSSFRVVYTNI